MRHRYRPAKRVGIPVRVGGSMVVPEGVVDLAEIAEDLEVDDPASRDDPPARLRFYERRAGSLILPRRYPLECDLPILLIDETAPGRPVRFRSRILLRPHQEAAVAAMVAGDGIVKAPTGSGKTVMSLEAVARRGRAAMILCNTKVLLDQWVDRISEHLGLAPDEVGRYGGGKKAWAGRKIVVGLVQSAWKGVPEELARDSGTLVLDEIHHGSAKTWISAICQFPAARRIGLTATPTRKDGLEFVFHWHVGPILHEVSVERVEPVVCVVETGVEVDDRDVQKRPNWRRVGSVFHRNGVGKGTKAWNQLCRYAKDKTKKAWARLARALEEADDEFECLKIVRQEFEKLDFSKFATLTTASPSRLALVEGLARRAAAAGRNVLVLLDRKAAAVGVGAAIQRSHQRLSAAPCGICVSSLDRGLKEIAERLGADVSVTGHSRDRAARRREALSRQILVATSELVKEGFDRPDLDLVIDGGIYSSPTRAIQVVGRVSRPHPGKPRPIAIVLADAHPLARHFVRQRVEHLVDEGFEINNGLPDFLREPTEERVDDGEA